MKETYTELAKAGYVFRSLRMGECFHANETMHAANALGLTVDSTAIPGRKRNDSARVFDWLPTPDQPYFPSQNDCRVPAAGGSLPILEVPVTTMRVRAPYDVVSLKRYMNLTYHHHLFREGFDESFSDLLARSIQQSFIRK